MYYLTQKINSALGTMLLGAAALAGLYLVLSVTTEHNDIISVYAERIAMEELGSY